jgi:hypothetical protein
MRLGAVRFIWLSNQLPCNPPALFRNLASIPSIMRLFFHLFDFCFMVQSYKGTVLPFWRRISNLLSSNPKALSLKSLKPANLALCQNKKAVSWPNSQIDGNTAKSFFRGLYNHLRFDLFLQFISGLSLKTEIQLGKASAKAYLKHHQESIRHSHQVKKAGKASNGGVMDGT